MKKVLLSLVFAISAMVSYAQLGNIKGTLRDENGLALPGATIQLTDLSNIGAVSDIDGSFVIFKVPAGDHTLKITYIGYKEIEQKVSVQDGVSSTVELKLDPGVVLGQEVMVLGDRLKGQAKALNRQKTNANITNIVASDQIGRFPDANIGDAVKRIPGITIQNDQGEARNIIIRGMAPQLNSVTLNGDRIPSAEGDNRNIQLDLIPSDMIQTIEVNKAVTPDMDADAIGGSVNLVTRSAPSGMRVSGTLASGYNMLSEKPIYTGAFILGNRFFEDKLGAMMSVSYNNHDFGSDNVEAEWENEAENNAGDDVAVDPYIGETDIRKYRVQRVRRSASLNLDYKINENHKLFIKSMYNWRDDRENRYRLRTRSITPIFDTDDATVIGFEGEQRRQTKGGIDGGRTDNRRLEDQRVKRLALSGEHFFGNAKLTWTGSYAKASEERPNERYISYESSDSFELNHDVSDPKFPFVGAANASDVALGTYDFREITEEHQYTTDEDKNLRIDLELPLSIVSDQLGKFKVGGRLRSKSKVRNNSFFSYEATDGNAQEFSVLSGVPTGNQTDADFLAGSEYQAGSFVDARFLGSLDLTNSSLFDESDEPAEYLAGNYSADETITAGYVMLDQQFTSKLSALGGVRVENTSIAYIGNQIEAEENLIGEVSDSDSYTNVLPGLHMKYDATNDLIIRAAWTNTLARPNYYDLVPYVDDRSEDDDEIFLGNSSLKPTKSMNFDFMAENYFKSIGLISAGYFYKNVEDFVFTSVTEDTDGNDVSQPKNGAEAKVSGVEFSVQRQLDFLPGALKGLGVYVNYTYTDSEATGVTERDDLGLPGTAKNMFNGSLSFETSKLVLRASANYSSDYLDEAGGSAFSDRYYDSQFFLDINGSYAVTPNWRVFFEANNLTNQPLRYYQGVQERTMQMEYYNSRFNIGLKFDLFNN